MDGNGGCYIARWADGGYDMSKMDMIMLKYRPIAPKPVADYGSLGTTSEDNNNSPRDGRHAKPAARGRKKNNNSNAKKCNGKKRKSSSPDNYQTTGFPHDLDVDQDQLNKGSSVTLLPLFPESPDLMSFTNNNQANTMTTWLNLDNNNNYYYNNSTPGYEDNYGNCYGSW